MNDAPADRMLRWLFVSASIALWLMSIYRAATYPFVHDESLSFRAFTSDPGWLRSANHHLLNTWLMQVCSSLFGVSPLSLRLPNLLAHALYLGSVLALLSRVRLPAARLCGFALLNLNLFALDFFALARGYGLALGFTALGMWQMVRSIERKRQDRPIVVSIAVALGAGALALSAHLVFLNVFLPLLAVGFWLLLTDGSFRRFRRTAWPAAVTLLTASVVVLAAAASRLLQLQRDGEIGFGGTHGILRDSVTSLVQMSWYRGDFDEPRLHLASVAVAMAWSLPVCAALAMRVWRRRGSPSLLTVPVSVLILAVACPIALHAAGALFPIDRAAVFYIPLYGVTITMGIDALPEVVDRAWMRAIAATLGLAAAGAAGVVFARGVNLHTCRTWAYDANNLAVIDVIDRDRRERGLTTTVSLASHWNFEPSLNFHRLTGPYSWLAPIVRHDKPGARTDYVYSYAREPGPGGPRQVVAAFADTRTVLWWRGQ